MFKEDGESVSVVQNQPGTVWTTNVPRDVPVGLEYLTQIDQILVQQKVEMLEACCGVETKNRYEIKNSMGQQIYYAKENSGCLNRLCCGPARPFDMNITDNSGNEVLHFKRPLACTAPCFPCCLQTLVVTTGRGETLGSVHQLQDWSIFTPSFSVKDAQENEIFKIAGQFCMLCRCCCDDDFKLFLKDGETQVGDIVKQWAGFGQEFFTDADHFGIKFPMDLDSKMKAVLLGACMLIDFMYYEKKEK